MGVCVDRSLLGDRIVPHGVTLARAFGAKLTVVHALESPHEGPNATPTDPLDWEVQRTEARRHLAAVESEYADSGVPVKIEALEGRPAEEIRDWVSSHGVDLTVLASHGESGWTVMEPRQHCEVGQAVSEWRADASALGLGSSEIERMASAFEHEDLHAATA